MLSGEPQALELSVSQLRQAALTFNWLPAIFKRRSVDAPDIEEVQLCYLARQACFLERLPSSRLPGMVDSDQAWQGCLRAPEGLLHFCYCG